MKFTKTESVGLGLAPAVKKTLSLLLSLIMLFSITAGIDLSAYAATSGDYEYEILDAGTLEITGYNGSVSNLTIPSIINGKTVTSIGDWAFGNCESLTTVTIPNSVTSIGCFAFFDCNNLVNISIPESIARIDARAFESCSKMKSINLPKSISYISRDSFRCCTSLSSINVDSKNEYYTSDNGVLFNKDKTTLIQYPIGNKSTSYTIPSNVKTVGYLAFFDCVNLTNINVENNNGNFASIDGVLFDKDKTTLIQYPIGNTRLSYTIPNGVKDIDYESFNGCTNLVTVNISSSVKTMHYNEGLGGGYPEYMKLSGAFYNCKGLKYINVNNNNEYFASTDGVLFNKDKTELLFCPVGNERTSYEIPDGVIYIAPSAFTDCINLSKIKIPNSVTSINAYAFSSYPWLTSITIPSSVISIEWCAFSGCNLTDVYYSGTIKEWNKISIENNNNLINATIHCSNGVINCKHTYKTTTTKATTKKNGSKVTKCSVCGTKKSTTTIYYPKTISLSKTSYVYNGKAQKPSLTVKDSKGKKIAASNYTVKYTNNKNVGKATVTITFKGNYSGTVKKTFTIKPKATTLSSITAKSKGFTAKWKKQATQTTGYEIQYSTSSKFSSAKTVTVSKNSTTSKSVSKLNAKKKYYVRIRTYKTVKVNGKSTKIYSDWSKSKAVTTKK